MKSSPERYSAIARDVCILQDLVGSLEASSFVLERHILELDVENPEQLATRLDLQAVLEMPRASWKRLML